MSEGQLYESEYVPSEYGSFNAQQQQQQQQQQSYDQHPQQQDVGGAVYDDGTGMQYDRGGGGYNEQYGSPGGFIMASGVEGESLPQQPDNGMQYNDVDNANYVSHYYDSQGTPVYENTSVEMQQRQQQYYPSTNYDTNSQNNANYYGTNYDVTSYGNNTDNNMGGSGNNFNSTQNSIPPPGLPPPGGPVPKLASTLYARQGSWFRRVFVSLGTSIPFKAYILLHFYAAWIFTILIGFNCMYACMYRMFAVPDGDAPVFMQSMAYFTVLIAMHFFIAAILTLIQEYTRDFWNMAPGDDLLWGMNDRSIRHWAVYLVMSVAFIPVPFFWSIIYTAQEERNVLYFFQHFFFISYMIMLVFLVPAYMWMYWRALVEKKRAFSRRKVIGAQYREEGEKVHWYQHPVVLKEYGMDVSSLSATIIFTFLGFLLSMILGMVMATDGLGEDVNNPEWLGIGLAYFILIFFIREMSNSKRWYRVSYFCLMSLFIYLVFALAGCGVTSPNLIGTWIVLVVATQGLCLRKKDYDSREESDKANKANVNGGASSMSESEDNKARLDAYMCCCQSLLRACFGRSFESWFGATMTNAERVRTNRIRLERRSLWSDVKTINFYLMFFTFCLILLLIFGRQVRVTQTSSIATRASEGYAPASGLPHVLCNWKPTNTTTTMKSFSLMDLAFLSSLTYSEGDGLDKDFKLWFSQYPNFVRVSPRVVNNDDYVGKSVNFGFLDFYDSDTKTHIIVVRSFSVSTSWMRDIDIWGDAVTLQVARIAVPFVSSWPGSYDQNFVKGIGFMKKWFGGDNVTDAIEAYVGSALEKGHQVVLTGHGTNGGIAKIIAARFGLRVVAFNSPGTSLVSKKFDLPDNAANEVTISTDRDFFSKIDEPVGGVHTVECGSGKSETTCSSMYLMVSKLVELCGDEYGRESKVKE
eukprot:PhM_4_TR18083/c2_g1_i1/m.106409